MRVLFGLAIVLLSATASADDWDSRSGFHTEVAAGNGIGIISGRDGNGGHRSGVVGDATVSIGFHHVSPFHEKGILGLRASEMSWCMPVIACGGVLGMFFAPTSSFVGNEVGFDVVAHGYHGIAGEAPSMGFGLGIRPALRVARDSRFRASSYVGSFAPEVGLAHVRGTRELYLELSLYPLAFAVERHVAIQWDILRERIGIPINGTPVTISVTTALSVVML